jgi:hypothetical protein
MNAFSNYLETEIVNHLLRHTTFVPLAPATTLYFALFSADPGETGTANEVSGNAYARVAVLNNTTNFPPCSVSGEPLKTNGTTITFPKATPAGWGAVTHWGIFDVVTGTTNFLVGGPLSNPRTVALNDTPKIAAGTMSITIGNAAGGGMTAYAKRSVLDMVFGKVTFTTPAAVYTGLGTALTGEAITEWTDGGAATRIATTFGAPTDGVTTNTAIQNNASVATEATLTHYGIWDLALAGNLLVAAALTSPIVAEVGNTVGFDTAGLSFTLQ